MYYKTARTLHGKKCEVSGRELIDFLHAIIFLFRKKKKHFNSRTNRIHLRRGAVPEKVFCKNGDGEYARMDSERWRTVCFVAYANKRDPFARKKS